jgi:hypothetical protein
MKLCAGRVLIRFCTESENAEARLNVHALSRCSQARPLLTLAHRTGCTHSRYTTKPHYIWTRVHFALDRAQFKSKKGFLLEVDRVQLAFAGTHSEVDPGSDIRGFTVLQILNTKF